MQTIHVADIREARRSLEAAARRLKTLEERGDDVSHTAKELFLSALSFARMAHEKLEAMK
jgi:hypothetical protein